MKIFYTNAPVIHTLQIGGKSWPNLSIVIIEHLK